MKTVDSKAINKQRLTLLELESTLRKHRVFDTFGIAQLGVFGSFARGEAYHDIDFLLEENLDYETRKRLKNRLSSVLNLKIDVIAAKFADPIILYNAQKELKYVRK